MHFLIDLIIVGKILDLIFNKVQILIDHAEKPDYLFMRIGITS